MSYRNSNKKTVIHNIYVINYIKQKIIIMQYIDNKHVLYVIDM